MQKKYLKYICLFAILFMININVSYANTFKAEITGTEVALRSGPGTNHEKKKTLIKGAQYKMVDTKVYPNESGCAEGWRLIYYEASASGYVCNKYVKVIEEVVNETPTTDCEKEMQKAGFPASYWPGLCSLKSKYPNWQFKALLTGLDWTKSVNAESACGESYIQTSESSNIDYSCPNMYGSNSTWHPASSTAIAYYMDPRNFFDEKQIFQFENLKYTSSLYSVFPDAITSVVDGARFYEVNASKGFSTSLNDACKKADINPIFISARILNELGWGKSSNGSLPTNYNLYSGTYAGYEDYYNFYNYGVSDECANTKGVIACGLGYAKDHNWKGLSNALYGGADAIANSYVRVGQYTNYLQKFNVVPNNGSKVYGHQYMTNIAAPSSEAKTSYNAYNKVGKLNSTIEFYIPVYNNMVGGGYNTQNGAVNSPDSTDPSKLAISTIVVSSGFKYSSGYISGIKPSSSVSSVKSALESIAGANTVTITNANGNAVSDGLIGTGYKVTVKNANTNETLTVVVHGDTSGDGKINALDLAQVQKNILGTYKLTGAYNMAGDTSGDGKINALDLAQVQKNILGTYTIAQ